MCDRSLCARQSIDYLPISTSTILGQRVPRMSFKARLETCPRYVDCSCDICPSFSSLARMKISQSLQSAHFSDLCPPSLLIISRYSRSHWGEDRRLAGTGRVRSRTLKADCKCSSSSPAGCNRHTACSALQAAETV